jgi:Asp-tRNA(Asn)/Glu-tRNA(Gln) amidotransferase A subunit family amidase
MSKSDFIDANIKFAESKAQFIDFIRENKFDALLSPVFPTTALEFGVSHKLLPYNNMSFIHNIADLPSVVIPVKLNKNLVYNDTRHDALSEIARRNMITSENMPIAVQIATLPGQDEWVLRLAKEIDYFFRFDEISTKEILRRYPVPVEPFLTTETIIKESKPKVDVKIDVQMHKVK